MTVISAGHVISIWRRVVHHKGSDIYITFVLKGVEHGALLDERLMNVIYGMNALTYFAKCKKRKKRKCNRESLWCAF